MPVRRSAVPLHRGAPLRGEGLEAPGPVQIPGGDLDPPPQPLTGFQRFVLPVLHDDARTTHSWTALAATVVHHRDPWVGPVGPTGTAVFLLLVAAGFVPWATRRVRRRGKFTVGPLLVPVNRGRARGRGKVTAAAALRWSHGEAAFVRVDRALPAGWPTHPSEVSDGLAAGPSGSISVINTAWGR